MNASFDVAAAAGEVITLAYCYQITVVTE